MSEADFVAWWHLGYWIGVLVVLLVVVLFGTLLFTAWNIERLAGRALVLAAEIENSTRPVWSFADANAVVEDIARTVRSVERSATAIADGVNK